MREMKSKSLGSYSGSPTRNDYMLKIARYKPAPLDLCQCIQYIKMTFEQLFRSRHLFSDPQDCGKRYLP